MAAATDQNTGHSISSSFSSINSSISTVGTISMPANDLVSTTSSSSANSRKDLLKTSLANQRAAAGGNTVRRTSPTNDSMPLSSVTKKTSQDSAGSTKPKSPTYQRRTFISRSQDNLDGTVDPRATTAVAAVSKAATRKRSTTPTRGSAPTTASIKRSTNVAITASANGKQRPNTSLGITKPNMRSGAPVTLKASGTVNKSSSSTGVSASARQNASSLTNSQRGLSPSSLSETGVSAKENRVPPIPPTPLISGEVVAMKRPTRPLEKTKVPASATSTEQKISKTKSTVTELQKQRSNLENQVSDLVKNAETKQAEIATLRMELNRTKEGRSGLESELTAVKSENVVLKRKLNELGISDNEKEQILEHAKRGDLLFNDDLSVSTPMDPGIPLWVAARSVVDAATNPMSPVRLSSDELSGHSDCAESGSIQIDERHRRRSYDVLGCANDDCMALNSVVEWDRASCSSVSEVSVANLQDKLFQMEENHYSTNEELQATLQELTELQESVSALTQQNQELMREKQIYYESLCSQTNKLDSSQLQIQNLKHLLLSDTSLLVNRRFGQGSATSAAATTSVSNNEREERLLELLKACEADKEDLMVKFMEVRNTLDMTTQDSIDRSDYVGVLKDRMCRLETQVNDLINERKAVEDKLFNAKQELDQTKRDAKRLSSMYDNERGRADDIHRLHSNEMTSKDLEGILNTAREEKQIVENKVLALEDNLAFANRELDKLRALLSDYESQRHNDEEHSEKTLELLKDRIMELEDERDGLKDQSMKLNGDLFGMEERCKSLVDENEEMKSNIDQISRALNESRTQREALRSEFIDLEHQRNSEREDSTQFVNDLKIAVVVANDIKMEAEALVEQQTDEITQLKSKVKTLSDQNSRLRASEAASTAAAAANTSTTSRQSATTGITSSLLASSSNSRSASGINRSDHTLGRMPDFKNRFEEYRRQTEHTLNRRDPTSSSLRGATTSSSTGLRWRDTGSSNYETRQQKPNLCVRELVETIESTKPTPSSSTGGIVTLRSVSPNIMNPPTTTSSGTRPGHFSMIASNSREMVSNSKTSSDMQLKRPTSVDSSETMKNGLSAPSSESDSSKRGVVSSSRPLFGLPEESEVLTNGASVQKNGQNSQKRGILKPAERSRMSATVFSVGSQDDTKDPLSQLMKDAPRGSKRNALLKWCQNRTLGYENIEMTNFSSSWNDGLGFCSLLHSYLPDKIPLASLDTKDKRRNFTLAFEAAKSVGIEPTLSVDEMVALERPDWNSVMAYVTSIYAHFET